MALVVKSLEDYRKRSDRRLLKKHGKEWMLKNKKWLDEQWEAMLQEGGIQEAPYGKDIK